MFRNFLPAVENVLWLSIFLHLFDLFSYFLHSFPKINKILLVKSSRQSMQSTGHFNNHMSVLMWGEQKVTFFEAALKISIDCMHVSKRTLEQYFLLQLYRIQVLCCNECRSNLSSALKNRLFVTLMTNLLRT